MATIVRVKRRRDANPVENLKVLCKKRKTNEETAENQQESDEVESLLSFAGTVGSSEESISQRVKEAIRKSKLEKEYKKHDFSAATLTQRERIHHKKRAKVQRFQVLSSVRAANLDNIDQCVKGKVSDAVSGPEGDGATSEARRFHLLDIEIPSGSQLLPSYESLIQEASNTSAITCNSLPLVKSSSQTSGSPDEYVYDIYFTNKRDFNLHALESSLAVEACLDSLVVDEFRSDESEDGEAYDDEDDSNDESNWRNDYPDEDPRFYENQDAEYYYGDDEQDVLNYHDIDGISDLMRSRFNIEEQYELSSDEDEVPGAHYFTRTPYDQYHSRVRQEMEGYPDHVTLDSDSDQQENNT